MKRQLLLLAILASVQFPLFGQAPGNWLADGFEDNRNQWMEAATPQYRLAITEGHLAIDAYTTAVHTFQNIQTTRSDSYGIHTRMIFLNGSSEGWMGIRFNMSNDGTQYLTFSYNNAQGFLVSKNTGKKYEVLRESKSVVVKPYDYNTLTIVKKEDHYQFLINDKQVYQDDIKSFFGSMAGVYVSQNMSVKVDEFQAYDLRRGRQKITQSQVTMAAASDADVKQMIDQQSAMSDDFRAFYQSFFKAAFPYEYSTVAPYAKNISHIPFVREQFFQYDLSSTRYHNVFALTILSVCQGGFTFLVKEEYSNMPNQDVVKYAIVAFDNQGKQLGHKPLGSFVSEGGKYAQTLDFRVTQTGSAILFSVAETYFNGNVNKRLVSFNGDICNLNSF